MYISIFRLRQPMDVNFSFDIWVICLYRIFHWTRFFLTLNDAAVLAPLDGVWDINTFLDFLSLDKAQDLILNYKQHFCHCNFNIVLLWLAWPSSGWPEIKRRLGVCSGSVGSMIRARLGVQGTCFSEWGPNHRYPRPYPPLVVMLYKEWWLGTVQ